MASITFIKLHINLLRWWDGWIFLVIVKFHHQQAKVNKHL